MEISFLNFFNRKKHKKTINAIDDEVALSFDELNPLLAKQLSELEVQIGQLAQVQFELAEERSKMRQDMEALKKELNAQNAARTTIESNSVNNEAT